MLSIVTHKSIQIYFLLHLLPSSSFVSCFSFSSSSSDHVLVYDNSNNGNSNNKAHR